MVLQSFGDRVEVFVVSVPLSPSLGRIQPLSGIKLVTHCSQQVIFVLLIYYREGQATLVPIHIGSLSGEKRGRRKGKGRLGPRVLPPSPSVIRGGRSSSRGKYG